MTIVLGGCKTVSHGLLEGYSLLLLGSHYGAYIFLSYSPAFKGLVMIRMKVWIVTSKWYTSELWLFHCSIPISSPTCPSSICLRNMKHLTGEEGCNSWAYSVFCVCVCVFS